MVVRICQARLGRALVAKIRVFVKILLHQRAVVEVFEPAAAVGHGRFQHLGTDGQQHIAGGHAAELALGVKVGRGGGQGVVDADGAVHTHTAFLQHTSEVIEQLVGAVDCFLRTAAPLTAHVAVFGHFGIQRGFFGRDMAIIGAANDDVFQAGPTHSSC